jgi:octopine/nopaline transport system substrate-binding protein
VKADNADMTLVGPAVPGRHARTRSSFGPRKSDPKLKAMFDKAVTEAKVDGTIEKLSMTHFGFSVTPR